MAQDALHTAALMLPIFRAFDTRIAFTVACCHTPDMPVVFASSAFYELSGYTQEDVLGKNCRFMQGQKTSRQQILEMRSALMEDRENESCILNYKKDGTPFWNQFLLYPVKGEKGSADFYVGLQQDVSDLVEEAQADGELVAVSSCHDAAAVQQQKARELAESLHSWKASHKDDAPAPAAISMPALPASLLAPLLRLRQPFVLSDPNLPDMPICHVSPTFLALTGYSREHVVGRNCRFLQGKGTDKGELQRLREAIHSNPPKPVTVRMLNYRFDGTPFWNHLHVAPIRDNHGQIAFFVGVQLDITMSPRSKGLDTMAHISPLDVRRQSCPDYTTPAPMSEDDSSLAVDNSEVTHSDAYSVQQVKQPLQATSSAPAGILAEEPSERAKRVQQSVVAAVRVACRALGAQDGLRRSVDCQRRASIDMPLRRLSNDAQGLRRSADGALFRIPSSRLSCTS